jgi:hypothetical protein
MSYALHRVGSSDPIQKLFNMEEYSVAPWNRNLKFCFDKQREIRLITPDRGCRIYSFWFFVHFVPLSKNVVIDYVIF